MEPIFTCNAVASISNVLCLIATETSGAEEQESGARLPILSFSV